MTDVTVHATPTPDGWRCDVELRDDDSATSHEVRVSRGDLARLDPGAHDPEALVRNSFAFLLEREPKEAILRSFALPLIGRYFPDYEGVITRR